MEFNNFENYNTYQMEEYNNKLQLQMLHTQSKFAFQELDPDKEMIKEMNETLESIEESLTCLDESMNYVHDLIILDAEDLNVGENNVIHSHDVVEETVKVLDDVKTISNNNTAIMKMITSAIICGSLFGGVGAVFGLIPAIGGAGIGLGTGGFIGKLI
jgi:hypothetical protein